MQVNLKKKYKTVGELPVELIEEKYGKIWGRIKNPFGWIAMSWYSDGGYFPDKNSLLDLIPLVEEEVVYVNCYRSYIDGEYIFSNSFPTAQTAKDGTPTDSKRIACKRIVLKEGEFDE